MASPDLIARAVEAAKKYGLEPSLFCALIEQESAWNPWSIRFEPAFLERYVKTMSVSETEKIARSTSWGIAQVMGQVAREHSFTGKFLSELCDPTVGLEYGAKVLADKMKRAKGDKRQGLLYWNGGGRPAYADEVLARVSKYATGNLA
jgi:soluble lytic murein transglycosylase-like protein